MLPGAGLFPPFLLAVIANSDNIGVKQSALVEVELVDPPCLKMGFLIPLTPRLSSLQGEVLVFFRKRKYQNLSFHPPL